MDSIWHLMIAVRDTCTFGDGVVTHWGCEGVSRKREQAAILPLSFQQVSSS